MLETLAIGNLCFHLDLLMGHWQVVNETTGLASKHGKVQGSNTLNAELAEARHHLDSALFGFVEGNSSIGGGSAKVGQIKHLIEILRL